MSVRETYPPKKVHTKSTQRIDLSERDVPKKKVRRNRTKTVREVNSCHDVHTQTYTQTYRERHTPLTFDYAYTNKHTRRHTHTHSRMTKTLHHEIHTNTHTHTQYLIQINTVLEHTHTQTHKHFSTRYRYKQTP